MKEKLKNIVNEGANKLTSEGREYVYECASSLGIEYKKKRCNSCVIDLAVLCVQKLAEGENKGLRLKEGVDIYVNGVRVNAVTCATREDCEELKKIGVPKDYFYED